MVCTSLIVQGSNKYSALFRLNVFLFSIYLSLEQLNKYTHCRKAIGLFVLISVQPVGTYIMFTLSNTIPIVTVLAWITAGSNCHCVISTNEMRALALAAITVVVSSIIIIIISQTKDYKKTVTS